MFNLIRNRIELKIFPHVPDIKCRKKWLCYYISRNSDNSNKAIKDTDDQTAVGWVFSKNFPITQGMFLTKPTSSHAEASVPGWRISADEQVSACAEEGWRWRQRQASFVWRASSPAMLGRGASSQKRPQSFSPGHRFHFVLESPHACGVEMG